MMNHSLLYRPAEIWRFKQEAETLKSLKHPAVARLYDRFDAFQTQFLAIEFCEGPTMAVLCRHGRLPEVEVRKIVGQLAAALRHVHERGIVHRDIKPSNIIVTSTGQVKLLDFGIATTAGPASTISHGLQSGPDEQRTMTSGIGTPRYMAPERFDGQAGDYRVDFYGLACVAFEAVAGQPVIGCSEVHRIVEAQRNSCLPPAYAIGRGVSASLRDVLVSGLQRRPEERRLDLQALEGWAGPVDLSAILRTPRGDVSPSAETC